MAGKYLWNSSIFRNVTCCNNFSKVSLLFKKMAYFLRKVLGKYSEICIFCVILYINFLTNLYILPFLGISFKFVVFIFLENTLNIDIFTHDLLPSQNSPPNYYHHPPKAEGIYSFPSESVFSFLKSYFRQQQKGMEESIYMSLCYSISLYKAITVLFKLNFYGIFFKKDCKTSLSKL